jgi:hypothetical protein
MDYLIVVKQSYGGHCYIPKNVDVLMLETMYLLFCIIDHSRPFMGYAVPTGNRQMNTWCRG